jgi:AbrB family looped-hinge helix DNA binding protein
MALRASRVTRKGQVTIPIDIREKYEIKEGDTVLFEERGDYVALVLPEDVVDRTAGVFKHYTGPENPPFDREEIWTDIANERYEESLSDE